MTEQPPPEQPGEKPGDKPSPAQYYPAAPPPPPEAPAGYPAYPQYPNQPSTPGNTNGFAIAALVCGILPVVITNILAVIFGLVSLNQLKKRPQDSGKGMAVAGLVLGIVWLVLWALIIAAAIANRADRNQAGEISQSGRLSVFKLQVGDCFDGLREGKGISSVTAQPCTAAHDAEVMDKYELPSEPKYPGEARVIEDVEGECERRVSKMLPDSELNRTQLFYFYPTEQNWRTGDRTAVCVAAAETGTKLTQKLPRR